MIKLHPDTAQSISDLINTRAVSRIMTDSEHNTSTDERNYWLAQGFKADIELGDDFGIITANYEQAVRCMSLSAYKDASLA